jgi:excisionase family DNA binding protein
MSVPKALSEAGLLSTAEIAQKLSVHRSTVWLWINSGLLPHERVGPSGNWIGVHPKKLEAFAKMYPVHLAVGSMNSSIKKLEKKRSASRASAAPVLAVGAKKAGRKKEKA